MKLTQGLLPASKFVEGPDNEVCSRPDAHGGYEIGTWGHLPWEGIPACEHLADRDPETNLGVGAHAYHRFTEPERVQVLKTLMAFQKFQVKRAVGMRHPEGTICLRIRWHDRLVQLFSDPADLPVYYWAD